MDHYSFSITWLVFEIMWFLYCWRFWRFGQTLYCSYRYFSKSSDDDWVHFWKNKNITEIGQSQCFSLLKWTSRPTYDYSRACLEAQVGLTPRCVFSSVCYVSNCDGFIFDRVLSARKFRVCFFNRPFWLKSLRW